MIFSDRHPGAVARKNSIFSDARKNVLDTCAEVVDCIIPRSQPHQSVPKFSLALAISTWPKEMRWVRTLGTAGWISTFVVLNWQVWMCWSLLILGSSLLAERYGIRLRNESAGAKKHRIVSREKTSFFRSRKITFFRVFSDAQPDVVDHPESTV